MRPYRDEDDYWRIRAFLRDIYLRNDRRDVNWQIVRLDYWRWHGIENCDCCESVAAVTFLWESAAGQLVAVLNTEALGDVFFQVDPAFQTPELEAAMLETAESHLSTALPDGRHRVQIWASQHDTLRQGLLTNHGYVRGQEPEFQRRRSLDLPLPQARLTPGYCVRSLGDEAELPSRSWASWRAFHPDEPDEHYQGWEWYHNIQRIPLYRRDLDIVALASDGSVSGFCTVWYDDVTRTGCFEPVGVVPEHQQRGLGKAVMIEGLRRLQRMGATQATVSGYSPAANALYSAVISPQYELYEPWVKVF